uniref:DUF5641 domain-containing protein n=1 Tax=Anopheles minimus TaxID=112268 RepID=A0A182VTE1_9DIPT
MEAQLQALVKQREGVRNKLSRVCASLRDSDGQPNANVKNVRFLQLQEKALANMYNECNEIQSKLYELSLSEEEDEKQNNLYIEFEKVFNEVSLELSMCFDAVPKREATLPVAPSTLHDFSPYLPPLNVPLPTFDGSYEKWYSFKSMFTSVMNRYKHEEPALKLFHLRNSLVGKAAGIIDEVLVNNNDYEAAWKFLAQRYEDKRVVVEKHIDNLFGLTKFSRENGSNLRKAIDTCNKNVDALKHHSLLVEGLGEQMLVKLVTGKMDKKLQVAWETKQKKNVFSSYAALVEFLEEQCRISEMVDIGFLAQRYEDKRVVGEQHIDNLFGLTKFSRENGSNLRKAIDTCNKNVDALKHHSLLVEGLGEQMLVKLVTGKMDKKLQVAWETKQKKNVFSSYAALVEFLEEQCRISEMVDIGVKSSTESVKPRTVTKTLVVSDSNQQAKCTVCSEVHELRNCERFKSKSVSERLDIVKRSGACFNCLSNGHRIRTCRSGSCRRCGKKHHSLLHEDRHVPDSVAPTTLAEIPNLPAEPPTTLCTKEMYPERQTVLSTAVVLVDGLHNTPYPCRAILDSASQMNFVTERFANLLSLRMEPTDVTANSLNGNKTRLSRKLHTKIRSRAGDIVAEMEFLVTPRITGELPSKSFDISQWPISSVHVLADPTFNRKGPVDMLIGAESFWDLMQDGRCELGSNRLVLQNTKLGWIAGGVIRSDTTIIARTLCNTTDDEPLTELLRNFYKVESCDEFRPLPKADDEVCLKHFQRTHKRTEEGRYVVRHPFNERKRELGDSREMALRRFLALERKLDKQPDLKEQYSQFIRDKSRILPKKRNPKEKALTTPRAELLAALLLARMVVKFLDATELRFESVHLWSDSKIVLCWLKKPPELLQTYVSNRVSEIQQLSLSFHWHYISTYDNPADLISRGVTPKKLIKSAMWWNPRPLQPTVKKADNTEIPDNELPEMRAGVALATTVPVERFPIFEKLGSFTKMIRSMAYLVRLARFIKSRKGEVIKGQLTATELRTATHVIIRMVQREAFQEEILALMDDSNTNRRLNGLKAFLDPDDGIIRVGGRIKRAIIPYDSRHQMLLPAKHPVTEALVRELHINNLHIGQRSLLAIVRQRYWPLNVKSTIRKSMLQHFWRRWTAEYLPELQNRSKWLKRKVIKVGSLVLLADQNTPTLHWPLARIVAAHPGDDGVTRVVTVRTANGAEFKRAVTEVCLLPLDEFDN